MNALFSKLAALTAASESAVGGAAAPEAVTEAVTKFTANPGNFVSNLKYMAAGMVGIFLVIGAIILTIVVLGKLTSRKKKADSSNE